ncbi:MAG: hypothetical protein M3245_06235, partial [Actinomycetota bacterium]|nr:hypothetical protein [Actinomycetota bacterium]
MLRLRPPHWTDGLRFPRLARWSARLAMLAFAASLTLLLAGSLVYGFQRSVLPTSPTGLRTEARNRCAQVHERESPAWRQCLQREPTTAADDALPLIRAGVLSAYAGIAVAAVLAGRRPRP